MWQAGEARIVTGLTASTVHTWNYAEEIWYLFTCPLKTNCRNRLHRRTCDPFGVPGRYVELEFFYLHVWNCLFNLADYTCTWEMSKNKRFLFFWTLCIHTVISYSNIARCVYCAVAGDDTTPTVSDGVKHRADDVTADDVRAAFVDARWFRPDVTAGCVVGRWRPDCAQTSQLSECCLITVGYIILYLM